MRNPLISIYPAHEHHPLYKKDRDDALWYIPRRESDGAMGYDVRACCVQDPVTREVISQLPVTIKPGEKVLIGGGFIAAIPFGIACCVYPRSGLAARKEIILANGPGIIDPDYRGEIGCLVYNTGKKPFVVKWRDRIAQLLFVPVQIPEFHEVLSLLDLPSTKRDYGGFGSTGMGVTDGSGTKKYEEQVAKQDAYFIKIALVAGSQSNCIRGCELKKDGTPKLNKKGQMIGTTRKVGCIITISGSVVASGFNAQYPGAKPCAEIGCIREKNKIPSGTMLEICQAIHAEDMAINNALMSGVQLGNSNAVMYCTHPPCRNCARKIAGLGLEALVVIRGKYDHEGLDIVRSSGTVVRVIEQP